MCFADHRSNDLVICREITALHSDVLECTIICLSYDAYVLSVAPYRTMVERNVLKDAVFRCFGSEDA